MAPSETKETKKAPSPPVCRKFSGNLLQSSNSVDFDWINDEDRWSGSSNKQKHTTDEWFQSLILVTWFLFFAIPIVIALFLVLLRNTIYSMEVTWYTQEAWIGVTTPVLFGSMILLMAVPYYFLFAFWIQNAFTRVLFWCLHVVLLSLPAAMFLPLNTNTFTSNSITINIWNAILCGCMLSGVSILSWMLFIHASSLSQRSIYLRCLLTVVSMLCIAVPSILLLLVQVNETFGNAVLGKSGLNYGCGILLAMLLFGIISFSWTMFSVSWYLKNESVSANLVAFMTIIVVTIIAPLGGTAASSLVFEKLEDVITKRTQEVFLFLTLFGFTIMGTGALSRLELFLKEANWGVFIACEILYILFFAIPFPLIIPFNFLSSFHDSDAYPVFTVLTLVGVFLGVWFLALYVSINNEREDLLVQVEYLEAEEKKETERKTKSMKEAILVPKIHENSEGRGNIVAKRKTTFLGNRELNDSEEKILQNDVENDVENDEERVDGAGRLNSKVFDVSLKHATKLNVDDSTAEDFRQEQFRKTILKDPDKYVHAGVRSFLFRIWVLPTVLFLALVCTTGPPLIVIALSTNFRDSILDIDTTQNTFQCMLNSGIVLLIWIYWHGPIFALHKNFGTPEHSCRPEPDEPSSHMEILKSTIFLVFVFPAIVILTRTSNYLEVRLSCTPIVAFGVSLITWLEINFSRFFTYWVDKDQRRLFSVIWLGMVAVPLSLLIPDIIEQILKKSAYHGASPFLNSTQRVMLSTALILGCMWIPYLIFYHFHRQRELSWYKWLQTILFVVFTISFTLLATTTDVYFTSSKANSLNLSINLTIVIATLLLTGLVRFFYRKMSKSLPRLDSGIFCFMIVITIIFPLSWMPSVFVPKIASSLFLVANHTSDAAGNTSNITKKLVYDESIAVMWKEIIETLLVLGLSTLFWLYISMKHELHRQFPSKKNRMLLASSFTAFTAVPLAVLVTLAPRSDVTGCGVVLILEFVGPSLLLAWKINKMLKGTQSLSKKKCRVGILLLLIFGLFLPFSLLINAIVWPLQWNGAANAAMSPSSFYLFVIWNTLFVIAFLYMHENTLNEKQNSVAGSALLCGTTILVDSLVFTYLVSTHGELLVESRSIASTILPLINIFVMGGLLFSYAKFRLLDKFVFASAIMIILPVFLILITNSKMEENKLLLFLICAVPCAGIVWFGIASCNIRYGLVNYILWVFNGICYILIVPIGICLPLLISIPKTHLMLSVLRPVFVSLSIFFPFVFFIGLISILLKQCENKPRDKLLKNNKSFTVMLRSIFCTPAAGYWLSHIGLVLFVVATIVVLFRVSLSSNQGLMILLLVVTPISYMLSSTKLLNSNWASVSCFGICLPSLIGIGMLFVRDSIETSLALGILFILPFQAIVFLFGLLVRGATRSLSNHEESASATTAACCWLIQIPLGILLFILSIDWWTTKEMANLLLITISLLGGLVMINVSLATISINSTFKSIRRERVAKESTIAIVKELNSIDCEISTDVARIIFDIVHDLPLSEMKNKLDTKNPENRFINSVLEETGTVIMSQPDFKVSIESKIMILCKRCLQEECKNVRAASELGLCQACILDDTVNMRNEEMEAKRLADEGDMRKQKELKRLRLLKREKLRALKEEELAANRSAIQSMEKQEWQNAITFYTKAIECNSSVADYFYKRGLSHLQLAAVGKLNRRLKHFELANLDGERCYNIRPRWTASFILRGGALVGLNRFSDALQIYKEGLILAPECEPLLRGVTNTEQEAAESTTFLMHNAAVQNILQRPTFFTYFKRWVGRLKNNLSDQTKSLKDIINQKLSPLQQIERQHSPISGVRYSTKISPSQDDLRRKKYFLKRRNRISRVERLRRFNYSKVALSHKKDGLLFYIQIVDAVLKSDTLVSPPPRVFVKLHIPQKKGRIFQTPLVRSLLPSWKNQQVFFREWQVPHQTAVRVTLMEECKGEIKELGRVGLFMFQISRMSRERAYIHFDLKSKGLKNGKESSYQVGLAFRLEDQNAAAKIIRGHNSSNSNLIRRVFSSWSTLSVDDQIRRKRYCDEIFNYYSQIIHKERQSRRKMRTVSHMAMRQLSLKSELKRIQNAGKKFIEKEKKKDTPLLAITRLSTKQSEKITMALPGFLRFIEDSMLDTYNLHAELIFNQRARAGKRRRLRLHGRVSAQMGHVEKVILERVDFEDALADICRKKFPRLPISIAMDDLIDHYILRFTPAFVARQTQKIRQWNHHDKKEALVSQSPGLTDPRLIAMDVFQKNSAVTHISRWWRQRKLRAEAAFIITRWGKIVFKNLADLPIRKLNQDLKKIIAGALDVDQYVLHQNTMKEKSNTEAIHRELEREPTCFERLVLFGKQIRHKNQKLIGEDVDSDEEIDEKEESEVLKNLSGLSKTVDNLNKLAARKSKALRKLYRPWKKITKRILKVVGENAKAESVPLFEPGPNGRRKDVAVDWTLQDNWFTIFAAVAATMWKYSSVALTNGPLSYEYEKISNNTQVEESSWRTEMFANNQTAFVPYVVDLVMFLPKFQLPPYYGDTYYIFYATAMFFAFVYPLFAIVGVLRVKKGNFGIDEKGKPTTICSRNGCIESFLSITTDYLYFGIMTTLMASFACQYNGPMANNSTATDTNSMNITNKTKPVFSLVVSQNIACFDIEAPSHLILMVFGGSSILLFYPLATLLSPNFQFQNKGLDIKYAQSFLILEHQASLLLAALEVFFSKLSTDFVLVLQMIICLFMGGMSYYTKPCLVYRLNVLKTTVYFLCAWTSFSVLCFRATLNYIVVSIMVGLGWIIFPSIGYLTFNRLKRTLAIAVLTKKQNDDCGKCYCCSCCLQCFPTKSCCKCCKKNGIEKGGMEKVVITSLMNTSIDHIDGSRNNKRLGEKVKSLEGINDNERMVKSKLKRDRVSVHSFPRSLNSIDGDDSVSQSNAYKTKEGTSKKISHFNISTHFNVTSST